MGIDWFTFAAQIINFLILVWLLKKVLYKPVLKAMAKREERIAHTLEQARQKVNEAEAEKEKHLALQKELQAASALEMRKAREKAEAFRENMMLAARQDIDADRKQWLAALEKEKKSFLKETSRTIADYFQQLAVKALRDLAGTDLEDRIVAIFLSELDNLSETEMEKLRRAAAQSINGAVITSAFDLSSLSKEKISRKLDVLWGKSVYKNFRIDQELLAGINVEVNGRKAQWEIGKYLQSFEKNVSAALDKQTAA